MSKLFKSKKKEVSKTEIDPQIYNRVLQNLQFAEQVSAIPYEPYRGLMVAPFTRDYMAGEAMTRRIAQEGGFVPEIEAAARQSLADLGYQAAPITTRAIDTSVTPERVTAERIGASLAGGPERIAAERIGASLGYGPSLISAGQVGTQFAAPTVSAGQVGTTFRAREVSAPGAAPTVQAAGFLEQDLSRYINPYQQGVIDVGLSDIARAEEQARAARSARATAARAFGGSRAAIEEGIAAGEAARERNRYIAEQRAQSFREAAALRESDVGREQQARLANQAAQQNVMELAQRGEITNQQRDIELERLRSAAEQMNVESALRASLANQQAEQAAQEMRLRAETTNVQAALEAGRSNQQAIQDYMRMGLTAEQANQQAALDASARNQAAVENYMRMGLSAEEANQRASAEAAARNQEAALQARQMTLGAEESQAQRELEAQRASEAARLSAGQFRGATAGQLAEFGQMALQNRYGAGSALMGLGTAQQNLYQQFLNAQREEDLRRQMYPLQQLAIRQGAVQASPYNVTQTGTVTSQPSYWQMAGQVASAAAPFFSDEEMKTQIKPIKNPLDKVRRLEGVTFNWKDGEYEEENDDEGEDASVIAQDVEKVMPSAVRKNPENGMRQVSAPQLIGLLTEAVKELDAKVEGKKMKRAK